MSWLIDLLAAHWTPWWDVAVVLAVGVPGCWAAARTRKREARGAATRPGFETNPSAEE